MQSEEELMSARSIESCSEGATVAPKPKKVSGKLKVQGKINFQAPFYQLFSVHFSSIIYFLWFSS